MMSVRPLGRWAPLYLVAAYLLSLYSPTGGQFTGTASLTPPSSVESTLPNNHGRRYNIIAGSSFTISCDVRGSSGSFVADFYIDNLTSPITNETLADTFITKTDGTGTNSVNVTLTFNNFQAAHNGRYICQANTTDGETTESTRIGHVLYGTGAVTVTLVTPRYQVYDSNKEIYVEVQIRGEFNDNNWFYHPTDPTGASSGRVTLMLNSDPGVTGAIFRQGLRIAAGSPSHEPGYYIPQIQPTQFDTRAEMADESTLYRTYASPSASLPTLGSQSSGSNLTVTCTATGYPEVTISFTTTDIFASNETGDPITIVTATPSAPFNTTRSITFYSITFSDCGSVTCTASNSDGTTTSTDTATQGVPGPPTVTISPPEEQVVGIGDSVTLTCSASDCVGSAFSFVWYRDGSNVSTSGVLTISNVTSSDFGEYTCM